MLLDVWLATVTGREDANRPVRSLSSGGLMVRRLGVEDPRQCGLSLATLGTCHGVRKTGSETLSPYVRERRGYIVPLSEVPSGRWLDGEFSRLAVLGVGTIRG